MPATFALLALLLAGGTAAAAWPLRRWPTPARRAPLAALAVVLFAIPIAYRVAATTAAPGFRVVVTIAAAVFAAKLLDLHVGAATWRRQSPGTWLRWLLNPYDLCARAQAREAPRPRAENVRLAARGAGQVAVGLAGFVWVLGANLGETSFWLEHGALLTAGYLFGIDGIFVLFTGVLPLLGMPVTRMSRHPVLAVTPADFWRRYNRDAGRFLREDVFGPVGGRRRPEFGILAVFLLNGLLHEYLSTVILGRVLGFQLAFFALQGLAVALSCRLRPRGPAAVFAWAATLAFMVATSVLFVANVDAIFGLYSSGGEPR